MKKNFLQILLFFTVINTSAQNRTDSLFDFNKNFTVFELRKNLRLLKDSLEIIHPALHRYTSKIRFDSAFNAADKLIDRPLNQVQFYGIVAPIICMIGDVHTTIEPSDESLNYLAAKSHFFPFDVRIIDTKIFISGLYLNYGKKFENCSTKR